MSKTKDRYLFKKDGGLFEKDGDVFTAPPNTSQ
jgi:hypothetical protein